MSDVRESELVELAAIVRSHGLRGELLLKPFNPGSTLLDEVGRVLLKKRDGTVSSHPVEGARQHGENVLLTLRDVRSRDEADLLRGSLVCVERSDLPPLEAGEFYLVDLVGLQVRDAHGNDAGKVIEVIEYPSADVLVVQNQQGVREVPNLERYVLEVDVAAGFVRVDNLDELELTALKEGR